MTELSPKASAIILNGLVDIGFYKIREPDFTDLGNGRYGHKELRGNRMVDTVWAWRGKVLRCVEYRDEKVERAPLTEEQQRKWDESTEATKRGYGPAMILR